MISDSITNNGNIVNSGTIKLNTGKSIDNYGIIINTAGGNIQSNSASLVTITNRASGIIKDDGGSTHNYSEVVISNYGKHSSYGGISITAIDSDQSYTNYATGVFESYGDAHFEVFANYGGLANFHQGVSLSQFSNVGGGDLFTNGTINNYGTLSVTNIYPGVITVDKNGVLNNHAGATIITSARSLFGTTTTVNGTLNNDGKFVNVGHVTSSGTFNNNGFLENRVNPITGDKTPVFDNYGKFTNTVNGNVTNYSIFNNLASGTVSNNGFFADICGGQFNNAGSFTGNPVVNRCSQFPITVMSDTTVSWGSHLYSGRPFNGEWAKPGSVLIGKQIDSITVQLQRVGAPPGTYTVGVYNANLQLKKAFGIISTSTLPTTYTDIEFKLPSTDPLYTIQQDDRIGVFYNGGDSSTGVNVMIDRNTADPFDGTNSQRVRFENGGWLYFDTGEDMYMVLKQTHA